MKSKPVHIFRYTILFLLLVTRQLFAQVAIELNPAAVISNTFGAPFINSGNDPAGYLSLGANIFSFDGTIKDISDGKILFVQKKGRLPDWLPASKGNFIALSNDTGYIHVFSGSAFDSTIVDLRNLNFVLNIFDRGRQTWVNPAFFLKGLIDTHAPRINALLLENDGLEYEFKGSKNAKVNIQQGRYSLLASITDTSTKSSSSGVFRIKAVLDGMSVLDNKLDMAPAVNEGISFLGHPAPSSEVLGRSSRLKVGELELMRGEHTLEVFAYDFAGNEAIVLWKLKVE